MCQQGELGVEEDRNVRNGTQGYVPELLLREELIAEVKLSWESGWSSSWSMELSLKWVTEGYTAGHGPVKSCSGG